MLRFKFGAWAVVLMLAALSFGPVPMKMMIRLSIRLPILRKP